MIGDIRTSAPIAMNDRQQPPAAVRRAGRGQEKSGVSHEGETIRGGDVDFVPNLQGYPSTIRAEIGAPGHVDTRRWVATEREIRAA